MKQYGYSNYYVFNIVVIKEDENWKQLHTTTRLTNPRGIFAWSGLIWNSLWVVEKASLRRWLDRSHTLKQSKSRFKKKNQPPTTELSPTNWWKKIKMASWLGVILLHPRTLFLSLYSAGMKAELNFRWRGWWWWWWLSLFIHPCSIASLTIHSSMLDCIFDF